MEAKIEYYIKEITYLKTNPETKDSFIKTEKQIREKRIDKVIIIINILLIIRLRMKMKYKDRRWRSTSNRL